MHLGRTVAVASLLAGAIACGGCAVFHLGAAMAQANEDQMLLNVPPEYEGLSGKKVAVVVDAGMALTVQFPTMVRSITHGISARIADKANQTDPIPGLQGAQVVHPDNIIRWQYQTLQWNAMSYSEMAKALGVDRIVYIDVYEYRLHPPGNSWLWEGVCAASVMVIEADGLAPDAPAETWQMTAKFPKIQGVTREQAGADQVEYALLYEFARSTVWLFHQHLEPKYPDRYRPSPGDGYTS